MHTGAALIAALAVMAMSFAGVIFTAGRLGAWMHRYLTYLATFSAGVFTLIAYHLANEAVHEGGWIVGVGSVLFGAALMEGIHILIPTKHHHHGHTGDHAHSHVDGRGVLISDAMHNIGDGILLVGAFASNLYIGIAATIGVLLHETVQEISEYFVLREAGHTNKGALIRNVLVSSTILIGFGIATFLSSMDFLVAIISGVAAGGFISVILHDLMPHALASVRLHGGAFIHALAAIVGAVTMLGLQAILPHEETLDSLPTNTAIETQVSSMQVSTIDMPQNPTPMPIPFPPPSSSSGAPIPAPAAGPASGPAPTPMPASNNPSTAPIGTAEPAPATAPAAADGTGGEPATSQPSQNPGTRN